MHGRQPEYDLWKEKGRPRENIFLAKDNVISCNACRQQKQLIARWTQHVDMTTVFLVYFQILILDESEIKW